MPIQVIHNPLEMQSEMRRHKQQEKSVCVVPTMGALHDGHLALIAEGRKLSDLLVVTLFVNPKQFGPAEDLDQYPRTFDTDLQTCEEQGVDYLFCPTASAMYPEGFCTYVDVEGLTERLCGRTRPGHFRGVMTIVVKLLNITQADCAVFGWKDAQQLLVLRRMIEDLHLPVRVVGVETVREADGLACSSRNVRLSAAQRAQASVLYRSLQEAGRLVQDEQEHCCEKILSRMREMIDEQDLAQVDYLEAVSMRTLLPLDEVQPGNTLIAVACHWGEVRLIDNLRL